MDSVVIGAGLTGLTGLTRAVELQEPDHAAARAIMARAR